jgi:hypothetical protein
MGILLAHLQLLSQIRLSLRQFNIQLFRNLLSPLSLMERLNTLELLRTFARAKTTSLFILLSMLASQNQVRSPLKSSSVSEESQMRSHSQSIAMENLTKTLAFMKFQSMSPKTSINILMVTTKSVFMLLTTDPMRQLHGILELLRSGIKKDSIKVQTMEFKPFTSPFLRSTSLTPQKSLRSHQSFLLSARLFSSLPSLSTSPTYSVLAVPTSLVCPSGASCSL